MFTKEQIDNWIAIGLAGDNHDNNNIFFKEAVNPNFKRQMVEMKVLIDRWDLLTTDYVFHSFLKPTLKLYYKDVVDIDVPRHPSNPSYLVDKIWGANIHYVDTIPFTKALVLDLSSQPFSDRHVAVFEVNMVYIQRVANLKVFW
jgi:hypothetical protein